MKRIFLFSFLIGVTMWAQADKMPILTNGTVTTTSEVLTRIQTDGMAAIKNKYSDLQKNFTPHFFTTGLDLDCRSGSSPAGLNAQYAGLRINTESKNNGSGQIQTFLSLSHFDCFGRLIFTERIRVLAAEPVTISVQDATKFTRFFEVQANEIARQYQIENAQAEVVFSVSSQRLDANPGERIYTVIEMGRDKWLELDQIDPNPNERRLYLKMNAGIFKAGREKFRMRFGTAGSFVLSTYWSDSRIEQGVDGSVVNQVTFDTLLGQEVVTLTTQMLISIFSNLIKAFPATTQVQTGVSDSPFLRQLQLNYNRMLTNTESDQVKLFFQKTIEDIKAGRIKVE